MLSNYGCVVVGLFVIHYIGRYMFSPVLHHIPVYVLSEGPSLALVHVL